jgi:hypothetical protein
MEGSHVTVHDDWLHGEVDRQLAEVRAACDGLATRSGLLIAATGVGATIIAARISAGGRHEVLLVLTLVALGIASLAGAAALMPSLKVGPAATSLQRWMSGGSSPTTSSQLYDSKLVLLTSNIERWLVIRILLAIQAIMTIAAVGLALGYSSWK